MLFTASTIKDSPDNVSRFIRGNLAMGVDHMFVFLDAPHEDDQREVRALLEGEAHVTCVPTTRSGWWRGDRPAGLNVRQRINANAVVDLLRGCPWAEWVFHIDGDEVAALDRRALDRLPSQVEAVWLPSREAVSTWHVDGTPTRFKRLLDDDELALLFTLGVIDEPTNASYFHGHIKGKSGVRPRSGLWLTLHESADSTGRVVKGHTNPGSFVLHYDAVSGEEFVRKWTAMTSAGPARFRPNRAPTAKAIGALVSADLPVVVREKYLRRIYELTTQDDEATLSDLGLLETADPTQGAHSPQPLPPGGRELLVQRLTEVASLDKRRFEPPTARTAAAGKSDHEGGIGARVRGRLTRATGRQR